MKARLLIISILVIFAILCSPVLAINKSDLIASYNEGPSYVFQPAFFPSQYGTVSSLIKGSIKPTPTPTPDIPSGFSNPSPNLPFSDFLKPFSKPSIPSSPIVKPSTLPTLKSCPPAVPSRPLYHVMVYCSCSPDATCDCVDPVTGGHYPIGSDMQGNQYIVKPGCQCTWAK